MLQLEMRVCENCICNNVGARGAKSVWPQPVGQAARQVVFRQGHYCIIYTRKESLALRPHTVATTKKVQKKKK